MPVNLQMTVIDINSADFNYSGDAYVAMLKDLQGNILKSHGRDLGTHLFLRFNTANIPAVKQWLRQVGTTQVTSAYQQIQDTEQFRSSGVSGGLFVNVALSATGYKALGFTESQMPDDPSFLGGAKQSQPLLFDPPVSDWQAGFQNEIDAVILLADDDAQALAAATQQMISQLADIAVVVDTEQGAAFKNDLGQVIEHFGFTDGVSQPLFLADDIERARLNGGLDKYDPSAPLGLVLLKDPNGGPVGYGSYLVYRKLAQDVAGFRKQEQQLAQALGLTSDQAPLAGAYIVGRFRDGTPVVAQPQPGWINEPNNFNYDADVDGLKCPFHAHIRKANPRGDKLREFGLPMTEDRSRRIVRRAISFGPLDLLPPPDAEVGLLFISAQSSIVDQFEFIQRLWANFPIFLRPGTGVDAIIGEPDPSQEAVPQRWPKVWGVDLNDPAHNVVEGKIQFGFSQWVTMRGGEYFFAPSLSFLQNI